MSSPLSFLALGDSYTIGESVLLQKSFPYQTVQILRKEGYSFSAPEIIARTGWTTDELEEGIRQHRFADKYDFVSLLIGVNNQYRGRDVMVFKMEFEELLKKAIAFAGSKPTHVIVLSIPDYSRTSYAEGKNTDRISKEIEFFNNVVKAVSIQYKVQFIDIAQSTKRLVVYEIIGSQGGVGTVNFFETPNALLSPFRTPYPGMQQAGMFHFSCCLIMPAIFCDQIL